MLVRLQRSLQEAPQTQARLARRLNKAAGGARGRHTRRTAQGLVPQPLAQLGVGRKGLDDVVPRRDLLQVDQRLLEPHLPGGRKKKEAHHSNLLYLEAPGSTWWPVPRQRVQAHVEPSAPSCFNSRAGVHIQKPEFGDMTESRASSDLCSCAMQQVTTSWQAVGWHRTHFQEIQGSSQGGDHTLSSRLPIVTFTG